MAPEPSTTSSSTNKNKKKTKPPPLQPPIDPFSKLALSPIYGSIPAAKWHSKLLMFACFTGWSVNLALHQVLPFKPERLLPVLAAYVPVAQFLLGKVVLAGAYALLAPSRLLVWTLPALMHTAVLNTHVATPMGLARLNSGLEEVGYVVLERAESVTGYISVIDSTKEGYRVMRCDHSLLGGEWVKFLGQGPFKGNQVAEPIYGVFAMLEAVRLVIMPKPVPDNEAKALVIGLGIGTTPAALVAHGIDTTVVELDPVVHKLASKYFQLPSNHTAVIEDAVTYTSRLAANESEARYDYIIHDVFTGGAEPIPLFTLDFLQNLHTLLKQDGVIAINYAGDFAFPPPRIVVNTIKTVFPTCRIFREHPRDDADFTKTGRDFTNMVIFCTKQTGGRISFREPSERDLLNSPSRRAFLLPQHEVTDADFVEGKLGEGILRANQTERLAKWHAMSAAGHWGVMRTVLPEVVWEGW
ncbi:hypothetical protein N0V88_005394 [Collariella sp. IMI 366227]|nr:hypothetical protein N0V88_005394 [Collariella sp. IMI 366227]